MAAAGGKEPGQPIMPAVAVEARLPLAVLEPLAEQT